MELIAVLGRICSAPVPVSFLLFLLRACCCMELVGQSEVGYGTQKIPSVVFDWLSGQVAMVKAVIKAIKAAGVVLNGSSDCCGCHKLNRERERVEKNGKERHKKWN